MGFNPNQGAPAPPPPKSGGKKKKEKTPRQVAERTVAIARERERITGAEFNRRWGEYNTIYRDYAGRDATREEARILMNRGIGFVTLAKYLAKLPAFWNSPIWEAKADGYFGIAKDMGIKVGREAIRQAIVNNWDSGVFQEKLRNRPEYLQSNEFRTTTAGLENKYRALYGDPTPEWKNYIQRAALARWSPEQWDKYLRAQPFYRNSSEYQGKLQNLQGLLGFAPSQVHEPAIPGANPKPPPPNRRVR